MKCKKLVYQMGREMGAKMANSKGGAGAARQSRAASPPGAEMMVEEMPEWD